MIRPTSLIPNMCDNRVEFSWAVEPGLNIVCLYTIWLAGSADQPKTCSI